MLKGHWLRRRLFWKRVAKYGIALYVAQAVGGALVGVYVGVVYPEQVMEWIQ